MKDFDVFNETPFADVDDLLNGVQYVLSLDRVNSSAPRDYALLNNYYVRYRVIGETSVLPHMAKLMNTMIVQHDLLADPALDPVRAKLQMCGFENVQECINACSALITACNVELTLDEKNLAHNVTLANQYRAQKIPVPFVIVNALCSLYEICISAMFVDNILDLGVEVRHAKS
jgi:hypothetical protein